MQPDNPSHILLELDARLDHPMELTLIGKSAMWLGYDNPPDGFGATLDVDTVVPAEFSEAMDQDMAFWDALQEANEALKPLGLYLTHIFEEKNIFLRTGWSSLRVPLSRPATKHLVLFRPATLDLILTKMMRGDDPQHMMEIQWMIDKDQITRTEMIRCLDDAVIPDDDEVWQELFQQAKAVVLRMRYPA